MLMHFSRAQCLCIINNRPASIYTLSPLTSRAGCLCKLIHWERPSSLSVGAASYELPIQYATLSRAMARPSSLLLSRSKSISNSNPDLASTPATPDEEVQRIIGSKVSGSSSGFWLVVQVTTVWPLFPVLFLPWILSDFCYLFSKMLKWAFFKFDWLRK